MTSVLNEIAKLRRGKTVDIDCRNGNRYCLICREADGTKTAYYFSAPVYCFRTRKLLDLRFRESGGVIAAVGSNADIMISDRVELSGPKGSVCLELPGRALLASPQRAEAGGCVLSPTVNGILVRCPSGSRFTVECGQSGLGIRENDRCLAFMREDFRPLAVLSCIGADDSSGNISVPARLAYRKLTDRRYCFSVSAADDTKKEVIFELNLYENKLFQDTTVESADPSVNNAFGTVGFIGHSPFYGEQWLYSRPDLSRIPEMTGRYVRKAVLHVPEPGGGGGDVSAFRVSARFCSFGSVWDNRVAGGALVSEGMRADGYLSFDVTSLLVDPQTRTFSYSDGLILKPKGRAGGFAVLATGDSSFSPQVLEVNYL